MKIAIVYPDDFSIWHFHKNLLKALKKKGFDVYAISAAGEYVKLIESLGVVHIPVPMSRFVDPINDLALLIELYKIFRVYRFDIVHNFTIKPNIYGTITARLAGIKRIIGTAEGLGVVFSKDPGLKIKLLRPLVNRLYRLACRINSKFWFVNPDDLELFVSENIITKHKAVLTISAGVDLTEYSIDAINNLKVARLKEELGINDSTKTITMIAARIIWSKGIKAFVEASELLCGKYPSLKFLLVGAIEKDSPLSVPEQYLKEKEKSGNFRWLGFRKDVKEIYAVSDLVVLPSYYREGVPNILLEAMAMGKPIITTNNVGCKEVIEDGKNGYLIPVKNTLALADAIEVLINDEDKRRAFGQYSLLKVKNEFDKRLVIDKIMKELYQFET